MPWFFRCLKTFFILSSDVFMAQSSGMEFNKGRTKRTCLLSRHNAPPPRTTWRMSTSKSFWSRLWVLFARMKSNATSRASAVTAAPKSIISSDSAHLAKRSQSLSTCIWIIACQEETFVLEKYEAMGWRRALCRSWSIVWIVGPSAPQASHAKAYLFQRPSCR